MSLELLPHDIELRVDRFAEEQQVSHDQAVLMLIETGLEAKHIRVRSEKVRTRKRKPGELLIGLMSSPEDSVMMDEILAEAMQARRRRWERLSRA